MIFRAHCHVVVWRPPHFVVNQSHRLNKNENAHEALVFNFQPRVEQLEIRCFLMSAFQQARPKRVIDNEDGSPNLIS